MRGRAVSLLCVCVFALNHPRVATASQEPQNVDPLARLNQSVESLVQRVSPSVVQIVVSSYGPIEADARAGDAGVVIGPHRSLGSGVIIDPGGYIVTNAHVVAGAQRVQVTLPSPASADSPVRSLVSGRGRTMEAKIVGVARDLDLAVLKVEASGLPALPMANYDTLRQGQVVFAFGSPEGLRNSVTMGVVSAVARQPDTDSPMVYIQTDAPINPGNSGGPLVNVAGEVVGIDTFIYTESGGSQGLGFAIPSALVEVAWPQLRKYGHLHRGEIGLDLQSITPELAEALHLSRDFGVVISDVKPGSPAAGGGLRVQDVIVSLNGKPIDSYFAMLCQSFASAARDRLQLGIMRGQKAITMTVVVGQPADRLDRLVDEIDPEKNLIKRLGILGVSIDATVSELMPGLRLPLGIAVLGRSLPSQVADMPLVAGDVIHAVNGRLVATFQDLRAAVDSLAPRAPVALQIERAGRLMFVTFTLE